MYINGKEIEKYLKYKYRTIINCVIELIVLFFAIALISVGVVGVHYCAQEPEFEGVSDFCTYIEHFVLDNAPIISIVSGFIGIIAAFWFFKPKFEVSKTLIWTSTNRLKVSVSNKHFFSSLIDISIEMDFIREERDGIDIKTRKIEMNKDSVSILYGRLAALGKNNTYLFHSADGFVWDDRYEKIRCRVTAVHNMFGIKRIKEVFFTQDQLKRGKLQDGQFISQLEMYTLPGETTWIPEIGRMLNKLQAVCEDLSYAIIPMGLSEKTKMIERIEKALATIKSLESEELATRFPCLKNNADTIEHIATKLVELRSFYMTQKNLNPGNKKKRKELIDDISKYIVFFGDQMEKDVNATYTKLSNKES